MDRVLLDEIVKLMLTLFKGKKIPEIINLLKENPMRFSDLEKNLQDLSKKVLNDQLKKLIKVGLIERSVNTHPMISVTYSISPLIQVAQPLFNEIKKWEDYYRKDYKEILNDFDSQISDHPFDLIINVLGDKWKPEILYSLYENKKRFGELKKELYPIFQRVLTKNLRDLESFGFIKRTVYDSKVLYVEYELTTLCETLKPIGFEMRKFYYIYYSSIN